MLSNNEPIFNIKITEINKEDKKRGIYNNGYKKNPTAKNLVDLINENYIISKKTNYNGIPYVIDKNGNIFVGLRNGNGRKNGALPTPHPTLIGGKNPEVKMAGLLYIRGGKIYNYDDKSGHYKPNIKSIIYANQAFSKLPKQLFSNKGALKNELFKTNQ